MECKNCIDMNDNKEKIELTVIISENAEGNKIVTFQCPIGFDSDQVEMGVYIRTLNNVHQAFMFQNPFFSSKKNIVKSNPAKIMLTGFNTQYVEQQIEVNMFKEELEKLFPKAIFTF